MFTGIVEDVGTVASLSPLRAGTPFASRGGR